MTAAATTGLQASTPDFVDAGDKGIALFVQGHFFGQGWYCVLIR